MPEGRDADGGGAAALRRTRPTNSTENSKAKARDKATDSPMDRDPGTLNTLLAVASARSARADTRAEGSVRRSTSP